MRRLILAVWLSALPGWGAISNLTVYAKSQTEICLSYDAPSSMATVTVEASLESDYTPIVDDLNTAYFANANSDLDRYPLWQNGVARFFCIGKRTWGRAASTGRLVGRGLEAGKHYYIRLTSGGDQATTETDTLGIPFGDTSSMEIEVSTESGFEGYLPTATMFDSDRATRFVDPKTGAAFYPVSRPNDNTITDSSLNQFDITFSSVQSSTGWASPATNVLNDDGATTNTSGTDWLILRGPTVNISASQVSFDAMPIRLEGSVSSETGDDDLVEVRIKRIGESCDASTLTTYTLDFATSNSVVSTPLVFGDTGRLPTQLVQITAGELIADGKVIEACIRKKNANGTLTLDYAEYDMYASSFQNPNQGGNYRQCQSIQNALGGYYCTSRTAGSTAVLYSIETFPATNADPDIRFLGRIPLISGGTCLGVGWDYTTVGRYYCVPSTGNVLYRCDYTGDNTNKTQPYTLPGGDLTCATLSSDLLAAMDAFVDTNIAHYPAAMSASITSCGGGGGGDTVFVKDNVNGIFIEVFCPYPGSQNSMAWIGIWKVGTGIVAAMPQFARPYSRWCGHHASEEIGNMNRLMYNNHFDDANGPYTVTLAEALDASETDVDLSGHPAFMNIAVGDVFLINSEYFAVTSTASFPTVTVVRGWLSSAAASHSNGATVTMQCASRPTQTGGTIDQVQATNVVWNFQDDPYGESTDNTDLANKAYQGHESCALNHCINNNLVAKTDPGTKILEEDPNPPFNSGMDQSPDFANCTGPADGVSYQTHPAWQNISGSTFSKEVYADTRPKGGDFSWGGTWTLASGQSRTYKAGTVTACSRILPLFGISSLFGLRNISGPANCNTTPADENCISDADSRVMCEALVANECFSGSSAGDIYVALPAVPTFTQCTDGTSTNICVVKRAGGTMSVSEFDTTSNVLLSTEIRDMLSINSMSIIPWQSTLSALSHLPDGSGVLFQCARNERLDMCLLKTPPVLADAVDRTTFGSYSVVIPSGDVPAMTSRAVVRFGSGYQDFCSYNRAEDCYAVLGTLDETTPFRWETELTAASGVSCASGCTVIVPYLHNRIYWYEIVYRDASGMELGSEPITLMALNGDAPEAQPGSNSVIRGRATVRGAQLR